MKSRFSSLDVSASIAELSKSLVGLRLQNIYDINAKTYLFKFSQKDLKILILIESGVRIHSTSFVRDKSNIPSGFCMKLRKHLRTRRLTALTQLGTDRVVDFKFGEGEYGTLSTNSAHHVIVELYDSGNIIFTGPDYGILSLLRIVELDKAIREADDPRLLVTVGRVYDTSRAREFSGMTREKLMEALRPFDDVEDISLKKKTRKSNPLKNVFRIRLAATYGTALLDHILSVANVDPNLSDYADLANSDLEEFNRLYQSFLNADQIILDCSREPQHGYIYTEQVTPDCADYSEFHPFLTKSGGDHIEFPSFDSCVDEYFSKIETQRFIAKARHAEVVANKKIEKVRESHANQLNAFAMTEESKALIAQSIEGNLEIIDATLEAIRNFMKSGLSWDIMKDYFENEKMKGNPASKLICGWNLEKSQVILSLSDLNTTYDDSSQSDESDGDYNSAPRNTSAASKVEVAIDINCTAYANARTYYSAKKVASKKAAKTKVASSIALEFAERKIAQNLQASQQKAPTITKVRYAQWFEKFNWFISSENYLIIGSHDKALIQLLVDQYMEADDVFVFADIDGASSVLIKNTAPYQAPNTDAENPVPPTTVREAGMLCLSQSKAWDSKIVTSAFWVFAHQVSRVPSGVVSNLPFQISGNKQWLPPLSLDMGIALLFEIDESCKEAHMWDRRPWGRDGAQNEIEAAENLDKSRSDENHLEETSAQLESDEEFHGNADETIPSDQAHSLEAQNGNNLNLIEHIDRSIDESPHETGHPVEDQIENEVYSSDPTDNRDVVETTADLYADITAKRLPQIFDTPSRKSSSESIPRGRRAKSKKNSKKYAEQDEEDRLLMMQLLGSQKGPQPKGKKEKAAFAKKQELEAKKIKEDERRRNSQKASDSAPRTANNDDRKFGEKVIPTDVDMNLLAIDRFIGNPNAGDILLHVIPVCAPWMTLKKYKYKIKLVPGAMKRGKAAKSATSIFSTMATEAEQADSPVPDLIKAVPEPEWIMAMLPKVKVVGSDQKRGKK